MSRPYLAWGKCSHCGFVGDMWWSQSPIAGEPANVVKLAQCPDCHCVTNDDEMPEYPAAGEVTTP